LLGHPAAQVTGGRLVRALPVLLEHQEHLELLGRRARPVRQWLSWRWPLPQAMAAATDRQSQGSRQQPRPARHQALRVQRLVQMLV
jgi:hypothetical protein